MALEKTAGKLGGALKNVDELLHSLPKAIEVGKYLVPALEDAENKTIPSYFGEEQQKRLACLLKREQVWAKLFLDAGGRRFEKKGMLSFAEKIKSHCEELDNKEKDICKNLKEAVATCPMVSSEKLAIMDVTEWALAKALPSIKADKFTSIFLLFEGLRFLQKQHFFEQQSLEDHLKALLRSSQATNANVRQIRWVVKHCKEHFEQAFGSKLAWSFLQPKIHSLLRLLYKDYSDLSEKERVHEKMEIMKKARKILDSGLFHQQMEEIVAGWKKVFEEKLHELNAQTKTPVFQAKGSDEKSQTEERIEWFDGVLIPQIERGIVSVGQLLRWLRAGGNTVSMAKRLQEKKEELEKEENRLRQFLTEKNVLDLQFDQVSIKIKIGQKEIRETEIAKQIEALVLEQSESQQRTFAKVSALEERIKQEEVRIQREQQAFRQAANQRRLNASEAAVRAARHRVEEATFRVRAIEQEKRSMNTTFGRLTPDMAVSAQESESQKQLRQHTYRVRAKVAEILKWLRYFEHHLAVCGSSAPYRLRLFGGNWGSILHRAKAQLLENHQNLSGSVEINVSDLFLKAPDVEQLFSEEGLIVQFRETANPRPIRREGGRFVFELRPARCRAVLWLGVLFGEGVNQSIMKADPVRFVESHVRSLDPSSPSEQKEFRFIRPFVNGEQNEFARHEALHLRQDFVNRPETHFVVDSGTFVKWLTDYAYFREFSGLESRTWRNLWGLPMNGLLRLRVENSEIPKKARLVWLHLAYPAQHE